MRTRLLPLLIVTAIAHGCSSPAPEPSAPDPEPARSQIEADIEGHFEGWSGVRLTETSPGQYSGTATIDGEHEVEVDVEKIHGGVKAEWSNEDGTVRGDVEATWE